MSQLTIKGNTEMNSKQQYDIKEVRDTEKILLSQTATGEIATEDTQEN